MSSKITKEFNSSHMHGEINFFLLNRLSSEVRHYPVSKDALPLIHKLSYAEECDKVMQYVFGKTLLCRNMEAAFHFADENNLDCITLDGDQTLESLNEDNIYRSLELMRMILESATKDLSMIQEQLLNTEKAIDEAKVEQESIQDKLKSQKEEEAKIQHELDDHDKELKLFATKKNTLMTRIEECNENICKLGPLPLQEQTKYQNVGTVQVMKLLTGVNRKLKRFHRMNMQAKFQHTELLNKEKNVKLKLEQLDKGYNGILELMNILETQKNDAILFTFKQSSENFSKMFKKLVPTGDAHLIMKTSEGESVPVENVTDVSTIKGIGISVSFDADGTQKHELKEMSGGEKSLLALTLIFALQKCSPVPFCVIDEVDSMLDSAYKPSLAHLIRELSKETQFLVTSHGHDLVDYGDQFYAVKNINQRSHVNIISKEEALQFVT